MGNFFNNGSMTMKLHILKVLYGLESHAKDGRCGLSRNGDIRRYLGKLVEKQTLESVVSANFSVPRLRTPPILCVRVPITLLESVFQPIYLFIDGYLRS